MRTHSVLRCLQGTELGPIIRFLAASDVPWTDQLGPPYAVVVGAIEYLYCLHALEINENPALEPHSAFHTCLTLLLVSGYISQKLMLR